MGMYATCVLLGPFHRALALGAELVPVIDTCDTPYTPLGQRHGPARNPTVCVLANAPGAPISDSPAAMATAANRLMKRFTTVLPRTRQRLRILSIRAIKIFTILLLLPPKAHTLILKARMKVLMLGWELPPHNSGGLGVACYQMCKSLARRNVEIEFVLPYQSPEHPDFMRLHGALPLSPQQRARAGGAYDSFCYQCSEPCDHTLPSDLPAQQRRYTTFVEELVQHTSYDALHAHDWLTFTAGLAAKKQTGLPLIVHVHATEFDRAGLNRGNELVHQIEHSTLLAADAIVAVSDITKNIIVQRYGIPASKIQVVHNALDAAEVPANDPHNSYRYLEEMKAQGYKVVVSLGRLSLQKGITHLLKAAQRALQVDQKLLFLIVGDGEMRSEVLALTASLGISRNVIFTGFLRGKKWRDSYAIGDIFVMPSLSEPFGLTALEAAAYGNAVLLSKQCGVGEVLHNTMQFDFWDTDRLANQIVTVAQHAPLQKTLAHGAQREVAKLTWDKAAKAFELLYAKQGAA